MGIVATVLVVEGRRTKGPRAPARGATRRAARFPRFGSISFFGANSLREGTTSRFSRISQTAVEGKYDPQYNLLLTH